MEKIRFVTKRSGWYALKSKAFWLFFILGVAAFAAGFIVNEMKFDINNMIQLAGIGIAGFAVLILICKIICCHHNKYYFYDSKVVIRKGVFHRKENTYAFMGVVAIETEQTFINRIFNVGSIIYVDLVGKYDLYSQTKEGIPTPIPCIAKFRRLKKYLAKKLVNNDEVSKLVSIG